MVDSAIPEIKPDATYIRLMGGLGNQMFQFAFGIAASRISKSILVIDLGEYTDMVDARVTTRRHFGLGCFQIQKICEVCSNSAEIPPDIKEIKENGFAYKSNYFTQNKNVRYTGYWQSPKYFESIPRDELVDIFSFNVYRNEILEKTTRIESVNSICVHVRRGDMVKDKRTADFHGSCSLDYFQDSMQLLSDELKNPEFFIFSDDPEWCHSSNILNGLPGMIVSDSSQSLTDSEEMYLMTRCNHFIISNSSFSWWAAYLSQFKDKKVIAPEPWFNDLSIDTSDLIPEGWRKLCRNPGPKSKKKKPEISIIIPCYKQAKYLPSVLSSVVAQRYPEWEAIIVDDGSPDETVQVANKLIESYPSRRIKLLQKPNGGLADARNAGIAEAQGKFILPLDADDMIHPDMLLKTRFLLESNPRISIAYTDLQRFGVENSLYKLPEYNFENLKKFNHLNCCSLFRKEAWSVLGGYNTNMVEGYEDWDFWVGCGKKGFIGKRISEPLFQYRVKDSSMFTSALKHHDKLRAQIIMNHPELYDPQIRNWAKNQLQNFKLNRKILQTVSEPRLQTAHQNGIDEISAEHKPTRSDQKNDLETLEESEQKKDYQFIDHQKCKARLSGKKILIFSDDKGEGGAANYNYIISEALADAGAITTIAQPYGSGPWQENLESKGVRFLWTGYDPAQEFGRSFSDKNDAFRIFQSLKPDLIYFSDCCAFSNMAAKAVAIEHSIPYVMICHSEAAYLAERFAKQIPELIRLVCYSSEYITVSRHTLDILREKFHFPRNKGVAIWNSCADKFFQPHSPEASKKLRRDLGIPPQACVGITTARFDSGKAHIIQVDAINLLKKSGNLGEFHFVWVGEGGLKAQLKESIRQLGLEDRVHLLGYRWDMPDLLSMADFFVLTSLYEGMPLSILEAMARGLPIVSTRVGGIPEQLEDSGLLLSDPNLDVQKTINDLQICLVKIHADKSLRQTLGERAKLRAEKFFRKGRMVAETIKVLAEACEAAEQTSQTPQNQPEFFGETEVGNIKSLVEAFKQNPQDENAIAALRSLRMGLVEHLLGMEQDSLQALLGIDYGLVIELLAESGLSGLDQTEEDKKVAEAVLAYFAKLGPGVADARFILIAILFFQRAETEGWPSPDACPPWLQSRYRSFLALPDQNRFDFAGGLENSRAIQKVWGNEGPRVLFLTGSPHNYMAPPQLAGLQLNAGPDWDDAKDSSGQLRSFKTPVGRYPIEPILRQIPSEEQPDILVCLVDASRRNMPAGLSAFRGPKVLLVADTHHMQAPLSGMMAYAASEPFDRICFLYDRHHIPFFQAAGFKNLFWLPGFTFPHADSVLAENAQATRKNLVGFVGQAGKFHPRRKRLLDALLSGKIPVLQKVLPQSHSLDFYAAASVGFNASLNGDLNLRVFEILSSGAALLTDSLGLDSGLDVLANSGCRFETYSSPEELVEKAKNLLANPTRAAEIGKGGRNWFLEHLRNEKRCEIFQRVAFDGVEPELFKIPSPPSFKISLSGPDLPAAVEVYEFVQELQRVQGKVTILRGKFAGDINFFKSLPRLEIVDACEERKGDLLVTSVAGEESARLADGKHLWVVDAENSEPTWPQSQGYSRLPGKAALFERKFRPFAGTSATLEVAVSAFNAGRLAEAEDVCRALLQADEKCAGAWGLLARLAFLNGDLETAQDFSAVAAELEPGNADFARVLAEALLQRGELDHAEGRVRGVLEADADDVEGLVLLGRILAAKGERANALNAFERALRLRKDDTEALSHYAMALQKFERGKDAVSQMRKAVALKPESVELQTRLGMVLEENARVVDALAAYGKASRLNPDVGFVWFRQGRLLNRLKRYVEAIPALEKAVALPAATGEFHCELAVAFHMTKRFQEALAEYDKALAMGHNTAAVHCNRGVILKEMRKGGDAIMAFHTAVKMDPSNVSYLNNLGAAALEIGLNSEALDCFEEAVRQNPKLPTARNNIGNLLKDRARGMDALPHYRKAMELAPEDRDAPSNYLLCHMYLSEMDPKEVFEEHRKWGVDTAKKFPASFKFKPREQGARLRVGFLSPDLCHHPVAHFIEPIFRHYDKSRFEFFAYGDQRKSDVFSERLSRMVDHYSETCSFDDRSLAKKIHGDRLDILFELTGHTAYNRLGVFSLKPAPVQATYLGYPGSTGLAAIDFRITDIHADPPGMTEKYHTEKLLRLPHCAWCYEPDESTPDVVPPPSEKKGFVTFGCFNNMAKLNPALFETWAEILNQVPGSHLRLKARTLTDKGVCEELKGYFTKQGIGPERLEFFGHTQKIHQHLAHYNEVDIALDSFPYHGTTTTCEAMWMGVPVVSRAGNAHVSRVGVSLLTTVGLPEFICGSRDAYIAKAVGLAGEPARLEELRSGMRDRMKGSLLMDGAAFAGDFAAALQEMAQKR